MKWKPAKVPEQFTDFINSDFSPYAAMSLCKAGVKTIEEATEHLIGNEIHDFRLIRNINKATVLIWKHIFAKHKICVFGDYDVDGVSASAVMFLALKKLGADVCVRLPDRIEEGYGISKKAITEQLEQGVSLFVTVDNGVRAIEETAYIKANGAEIVILDHHEPGDTLPEADALIDLHIEGETYPFCELTGSGLAWKVAHAMLEQVGEHDFAMSLVDLAAMGTVGDVAPLHGENRVIVKRAIKLMQSPDYPRPGVRSLMGDMSNITAEDMAFRLAPCLNAPGRLNSNGADLPLILLLETDPLMAQQLAISVDRENDRRKELQAECYKAIREAAEQRIAAGDKILVLCAEDAPSGIAGLLAGNLKEEYHRPAIVFCPKADVTGELLLTGSARSIKSFHMLEGITRCADLLVRFGGHKLAAGLTVHPTKLDAFREKINEVADYLTDEDINPFMEWDLDLTAEELNDELFNDMLSMEPYGAEAPRPVVRVPIALQGEMHRFMGADSRHLKLFAGDVSLVGFSMAEKYMQADYPDKVIAYGSPTINNFRGTAYKQIHMIDFATDTENEERGEQCGRKNQQQADQRLQDDQIST